MFCALLHTGQSGVTKLQRLHVNGAGVSNKAALLWMNPELSHTHTHTHCHVPWPRFQISVFQVEGFLSQCSAVIVSQIFKYFAG